MDFISIFYHAISKIKLTIAKVIQDEISYWKLYARRIFDVYPMVFMGYKSWQDPRFLDLCFQPLVYIFGIAM
jgi:hypothetical protein